MMDGIVPDTIASLEARVAPDIQKKLQQSSKEYESVFMSEMLNIMFKDVDMNPMGENSSADDTYKSMLTQQYGKAMTLQGAGIGLADPIYKSLLQAQIASQEKTHGTIGN